jgi:hypothetical protein
LINNLLKEEGYSELKKLDKNKQTQEKFKEISNRLTIKYKEDYNIYYQKVYEEEYIEFKDLVYSNFYYELTEKVI